MSHSAFADASHVAEPSSLTPLDEARADPEMREIAAMFLDLAPKRVERVADALDASDSVACERAAHSLCGSANSFGAPLLAAVAGEIEREARSGDLDLVRVLLERCRAALADLQEEFSDLDGSPAASAVPEPEQADSVDDSPADDASAGCAYRVVIADDDADVRAMMKHLLAGGPFDVVASAQDAKGAVEAAVREQPDVVVLDWVMPAGGGSRAALEIGDNVPGACIVGVSSYEGDEPRMDMMRVGARAFVPKEALADQLVSSIALALSL